MAKIVKEDMSVEVSEDKKAIHVSRAIVDEMSPKEYVDNYNNLEEHVVKIKFELDNFETKTASVKADLQRQYDEHSRRLELLSQGIARAKALARIHEEEAKRLPAESRP